MWVDFSNYIYWELFVGVGSRSNTRRGVGVGLCSFFVLQILVLMFLLLLLLYMDESIILQYFSEAGRVCVIWRGDCMVLWGLFWWREERLPTKIGESPFVTWCHICCHYFDKLQNIIMISDHWSHQPADSCRWFVLTITTTTTTTPCCFFFFCCGQPPPPPPRPPALVINAQQQYPFCPHVLTATSSLPLNNASSSCQSSTSKIPPPSIIIPYLQICLINPYPSPP